MVKNPIKKELFDVIVCPVCKAQLKYTKSKDYLICTKCKVEYPIKNGIPILMPPGMFSI